MKTHHKWLIGLGCLVLAVALLGIFCKPSARVIQYDTEEFGIVTIKLYHHTMANAVWRFLHENVFTIAMAYSYKPGDAVSVMLYYEIQEGEVPMDGKFYIQRVGATGKSAFDFTSQIHNLGIASYGETDTAEISFTAPSGEGEWKAWYEIKDIISKIIETEQKTFMISSAPVECPDDYCSPWEVQTNTASETVSSRTCYNYEMVGTVCGSQPTLGYKTVCKSGYVVYNHESLTSINEYTHCVEADDGSGDGGSGSTQTTTPTTGTSSTTTTIKDEDTKNKTTVPPPPGSDCKPYEALNDKGECAFDFDAFLKEYKWWLVGAAGVLLVFYLSSTPPGKTTVRYVTRRARRK